MTRSSPPEVEGYVPQWRKNWPDFERKMKARLEEGFATYGDGSFTKPLPETLEEIEEEIFDQIGWAFIALVRIQNIRKALAKIEAHI